MNMPTIERRPTCRYLCRDGNRCTAEAVDPNAVIVLCTRHLARALEFVKIGMDSVLDPAPAKAPKLKRLK